MPLRRSWCGFFGINNVPVPARFMHPKFDRAANFATRVSALGDTRANQLGNIKAKLTTRINNLETLATTRFNHIKESLKERFAHIQGLLIPIRDNK
jgi:hypothetical protein